MLLMPSLMLPPEAPSLAEAVALAVREGIAAGELVPDVTYSVYQLADLLGVSRSPVREGMLRLAEAGLVEIRRNRGFRVLPPRAPDIPSERFNALTRLDHNRAKAQLAAKAGVSVNEVRKMTIWGNHSATQYPDLFNAEVGGRNAAEVVDDQDWLEKTFLPTVQQRGAAIIEARGASSAASAANATIEHMRDWVLGTPEGDWVSMAVPSDGSYGVSEGLISSFPCTTTGGRYTIVEGCAINDFSRAKIDASVAELAEEREAVRALGLLGG